METLFISEGRLNHGREKEDRRHAQSVSSVRPD